MNINGESNEKNEEAYEELTCQVCKIIGSQALEDYIKNGKN